MPSENVKIPRPRSGSLSFWAANGAFDLGLLLDHHQLATGMSMKVRLIMTMSLIIRSSLFRSLYGRGTAATWR